MEKIQGPNSKTKKSGERVTFKRVRNAKEGRGKNPKESKGAAMKSVRRNPRNGAVETVFGTPRRCSSSKLLSPFLRRFQILPRLNLSRCKTMEDKPLGILRVHVKRGINLAIRDSTSSDPYVVVTLGNQKLKTRVINSNCNPVWNEQLTLSIKDVNDPIRLTVYDKDRFSGDDKMGDGEIDMRPFLEAHQMELDFQKLPNGCAIKRIRPGRTNCLAEESSITWSNGKIKQDMILRLRNVECGELEIMLEWTDGPGCKGLGREEQRKRLKMEELAGLLRIRVKKGINLARRDSLSSDPFVVITMGTQKLKGRTVENNCNPEWNEELTLALKHPNEPVTLIVYDKDTFTSHDKMGDAKIDIKPFLEVHKLGLQELPDGTVIKRVLPTKENCLSEESRIVYHNGKIVQDMILVLRNVECGEVEIQLER
ncbi:hypothetical protein HID58_027567 [Brassica napus]|uniref:C2 domain-containing protein n=1 Tax=Brassica napus TaxID=3708 RepID=A0ABQ8CS47_BRANA|nr:hypothetical protein HID58_027567 [Brassica napus]